MKTKPVWRFSKKRSKFLIWSVLISPRRSLTGFEFGQFSFIGSSFYHMAAQTHTLTHTHAHARTRTHTHALTRIHTLTHTHTHTHPGSLVLTYSVTLCEHTYTHTHTTNAHSLALSHTHAPHLYISDRGDDYLRVSGSSWLGVSTKSFFEKMSTPSLSLEN